MSDLTAEIIHSYTRAQAIEDGELIDVTAMARLVKPGIPDVVVTRGVLVYAAEIAERHPHPILDGPTKCAAAAGAIAATGWDLIQADAEAQEELKEYGNVRADYEARNRGARKILSIHYGSGDDAKLVLTVMLPGED